ncbi:universal stress protein [Streptomyces sp. NPDC001941]|uniref:universal stress protein n=1 Tax=Streptomyces sp. NPDC001941 TaxID=3154659 RepID=UPI00331B1A87
MNHGPVIAAVDGSAHSLTALDWARASARRLGAELVVAHALREPDRTGPREPGTVEEQVRALFDGRDDLPAVRYEVVEGGVTEALGEVARGARMLVMGSRGRGGFASLLLGSNSRKCAASAPCPVVVVPHAERRVADDREEAVVLGLNTIETAEEVVDFAFAEAASREVPLRVLTAYAVPPSPLMLVGAAPLEALPAEEDASPLEQATRKIQRDRLAASAGRHPGVAVESLIVPGDAAGYLVDASRTAALVVVGRHRYKVTGASLLIGSVSDAVLTHAHAPVAVVPAEE